MTIYLANPSLQRHCFMYREPRNNLVQHVMIERGAQIEIGHNWSEDERKKVIVQLERFGARNAAEAHGKMGKINGLVYRDDFVVDVDEIHTAHEAEMAMREERSAVQATRGALAFDRTARARTNTRPAARVTETEVVEEKPRGHRRTGKEVTFSLSVDPEGRSDIALPVA